MKDKYSAGTCFVVVWVFNFFFCFFCPKRLFLLSSFKMKNSCCCDPDWRLLFIEEFVIPVPMSLCGAALCCALSNVPCGHQATLGLCMSPGHRMSLVCRLVVMQQQVIKWNTFCSVIEMAARIFFWRKSYKDTEDWNEIGLHSMPCPRWTSAQCCTSGFPGCECT